MPQTETRGAEIIAERIREAVMKEVFLTELGPLKVTLSLGIATYPDHGEDRQAVIELADQSLYHAKNHGRNQSVTVVQMRNQSRSIAQVVGG
jgi:diguanylate cyclase (GGDEF)-like protein